MLNLPKKTELNQPLAKKAIFAKFKPDASERKRFDRDISRMVIVNEVSPESVNIAKGKSIASFHVVHIALRQTKCDSKNLALLSKLVKQNMLFVLEHNGVAWLAVVRSGRVVESEPKPLHEWELKLTGLDMDAVWDNIIVDIGGLTIAEGNTLDEQIEANAEQEKLKRKIEGLERKAWSEKQPKRKWELNEEVKHLRDKME